MPSAGSATHILEIYIENTLHAACLLQILFAPGARQYSILCMSTYRRRIAFVDVAITTLPRPHTVIFGKQRRATRMTASRSPLIEADCSQESRVDCQCISCVHHGCCTASRHRRPTYLEPSPLRRGCARLVPDFRPGASGGIPYRSQIRRIRRGERERERAEEWRSDCPGGRSEGLSR